MPATPAIPASSKPRFPRPPSLPISSLRKPPPSPSRTTPPPRARARWSPPRRLLRQRRPQTRPRPQLRCTARPRNTALMDRPRLRHRASRAARPAAMPSPRSNSRSVSLHSKPHRASRATAIPTTPITRSRRATAIRSIRPRSRSRTTATRLPASPVRMAGMASSPSRAVCSVSALPVPVRRTVKVRPSRDSPVSPAPPSRACPRRRATSSSPWSPPFWLRPSAWASVTAPSPAA